MKATVTTNIEYIGNYGEYDIYITDCTVFKQYIVLHESIEPIVDNVKEHHQANDLEQAIDIVLINTMLEQKGYNITIADQDSEEDKGGNE